MHVREQVPLASLTTLGIGGPAAVLLELTDPADLPEIAAFAAAHGTHPLVLGGGSNVLAADSGCSAPVIKMATEGIRFQPDPDNGTVLMTVDAGHSLQDLVDTAIAEGLTGMETLTGIPGTVGATPVQNVGAYGQEVADTLVSVDAWDWEQGRAVSLSAEQCRLGHRTSIFKHSHRWLLLRVVFRMRPSTLSTPITYRQVADALDVPLGTRVPLAEAAAGVLAVRQGKGMVLMPGDLDNRNAGSVFLSPVITPRAAKRLRAQDAPVHDFSDGSTRVSASWLIKETGFALGQWLAEGVRLSTKQYTLVADQGATAAAFAAAAEAVMDAVYKTTSVRLTPEPDLFGDEPTYRRLTEQGLPRLLEPSANAPHG
ncbi:UDP-N-acetylmuramate dehydrogenase [Streptomyces sp. GC420]|uniref:UDP-N-acetylmuramate dehydrogenase n=1 Tax=Streptomyces sp. GC420 TaxID=2697568 RepID=UPI001414D881|nr:UDP-N-acetylmuramate dehydrogenase [Streptomyces sp. GC420]NBM14458.1 UDP-N-acetylmuramate dehydrogenase [Streptomyces sp. GC420]